MQQMVILPFETRLQRHITANTVPKLEVESLAPKIENTIFTKCYFIVACLTCMLLCLSSLTVSDIFVIIVLSYLVGLLYHAKDVENVSSRH